MYSTHLLQCPNSCLKKKNRLTHEIPKTKLYNWHRGRTSSKKKTIQHPPIKNAVTKRKFPEQPSPTFLRARSIFFLSLYKEVRGSVSYMCFFIFFCLIICYNAFKMMWNCFEMLYMYKFVLEKKTRQEEQQNVAKMTSFVFFCLSWLWCLLKCLNICFLPLYVV